MLKPGGRVAVLDFNNCSDNTVADTFQSWYLDALVVPTARAYGVAEEYEYLRPSILKFPTGEPAGAFCGTFCAWSSLA